MHDTSRTRSLFLSFSRKPMLIVLFLSVLLLCSGCASVEKSTTFFAMDTVMSVTCYGKNANNGISAVQNELTRLDTLLDAQDPQSDLNRYNNGEAASDETTALIADALELCALTDGALDITLRPASLLWGFGTEHHSVPTQKQLNSLKDHIGWERLANGEAGVTVDLGSVAKGYASDRAAELLRQNGIDSAILSLGGNIRVLGTKPDGSPYTIGIRDPQNDDALALSVSVTDTSVITSGSYQRYFESDGKRYHHILDPETLCPAESGLSSVTIVCQSGLYADALSTALFVMGRDDAVSFYRAQGDFDMILIDENANIFYTEGLSPTDLSDNSYEYHKIVKNP